MSLTLSRKKDESILISTRYGEKITITVKSTSPSQVKLNIVASDQVKIMREEIERPKPSTPLG